MKDWVLSFSTDWIIPSVVVGIILYLIGLSLAGGPRSRVVNWMGTILSTLGLTLVGLAVYRAEFA